MSEARGTIDEQEVARFSRMSSQWWDARGPMAQLHKFNPVRLGYIRDRACRRFGRDPKRLDCLRGLRVLDIGCGGGILSEPLARLGADMVGADPAEANIEAARRAIETFGEGVVVILGGRFKGGDFADLAQPLADRHATVIAIGESRERIVAALGNRVAVHEAGDMGGAVRQAFAAAAPGTTVVLAPACSSFDMFRSYAHRGDVFQAAVRALPEVP